MTLGAIQDDSLIYAFGQEVGRQLNRMGVHINFAPVLDINTNESNPVIGMRSFGSDKSLVARKGRAYIEGMQSQGIISVAKHFPGHGDTDKDSHKTLPTLLHSAERLDSLELYPFKQVMDDVGGTMVAHLNIPAWEKEENMPSTLSTTVVNKILKRKLKFDGLVFTDALNMQGFAAFSQPGEAELDAFKAGNDILLFPQNVPRAVERFKKALKKKEIKRSALNRRVRKILRAKYEANLHRLKPIKIEGIVDDLNNITSQVLNRQLYQAAITTVRNKENLIPVSTLGTSSFASLSLGIEGQNTIQHMLDNYAEFWHFSLDNGSTQEKRQKLLQTLSNFDKVVVAVGGQSKGASRKMEVSETHLDFLNELREKTNVILVILGSPYTLEKFSDFDHILCTYEDNEITRALAPQIIMGSLGTNGLLPIALNNFEYASGVKTTSLSRLGYGLPESVGVSGQTLQRIDSLMAETIKDQSTPGGQILVARRGKVVYSKNFGYQTYDSVQAINSSTIYDIASITKVAATLQAAMFLYDWGLLDVNKRASYYLKELKGTNKEKLVLRDILLHQAGLTPFIPFWSNTIDDSNEWLEAYYRPNPDSVFTQEVVLGQYTLPSMRDSLWSWTIESDLLKKPRRRKSYEYKYSDVGFYILQRVVETLLDKPLNEFVEDHFYKPLGMNNTGYLPLCHFPRERIAPTEEDTYFRHTLIRGVVHDQGAALYGGVAGHAGVFSTANDLAKLFQMNLQNGTYGGVKYMSAASLEKFTARQNKENRRGLGWDKPGDDGGINAGDYASPSAFGHTGFTGTSAWIDPEFDLIYIFISNRIYPDASNNQLIHDNIRTRIHNIVYEAMIDFSASNE